MAKRTERNDKVTLNSVEMTRSEVINDLKEWLRNATSGISGNAQKSIIDAVLTLIGDDKRNEDWVSVETDTYHKVWETLCSLWADPEGQFVGLNGKSFDLFTEWFDDVIIDKLWKANKDLEVLGYEKVNAYSIRVSFTIKGSAFWMTFRSITGKASKSLALLKPRAYIKKGHESDEVKSAIFDVVEATRMVTIGDSVL